jgi:DNA-binding transcriptional MerR regulator
MRIGQFSKRARVSIQTLRFYERKKLLREPPRTPSGYPSDSESDLVSAN